MSPITQPAKREKKQAKGDCTKYNNFSVFEKLLKIMSDRVEQEEERDRRLLEVKVKSSRVRLCKPKSPTHVDVLRSRKSQIIVNKESRSLRVCNGKIRMIRKVFCLAKRRPLEPSYK